LFEVVFNREAPTHASATRDSPTAKRVLAVVCVAVGAVAATYLWAVLFGHGLSGLKDSASLDRQSNSADYPNANIAFIAALIAFFGAGFYAWWWGDLRRGTPVMWWAVTATAGLVIFGVALLLS
jgi:hypothetical protein